MIIDFERSLLEQLPRRALDQIVPKKRTLSYNTAQGKVLDTSRRDRRGARDKGSIKVFSL